VPLAQAWQLAGPWYANRLDRLWVPRTALETARLLSDAGLTGEFWQTT